MFLLFHLRRSLNGETSATVAPVGTLGDDKPLFTCLALYNFEAKVPGDLSLQIDEKVDVFGEDNGWYNGVSQRTHLRGIFPANHVQKLQPSLSTSCSVRPDYPRDRFYDPR